MSDDIEGKLEYWAFKFCGKGEQEDAASDVMSDAAREFKKMREALRWYADPRNHFPVERLSPGDPDRAVIFIEEPPIMNDGGMRARKALEVEP